MQDTAPPSVAGRSVTHQQGLLTHSLVIMDMIIKVTLNPGLVSGPGVPGGLVSGPVCPRSVMSVCGPGGGETRCFGSWFYFPVVMRII